MVKCHHSLDPRLPTGGRHFDDCHRMRAGHRAGGCVLVEVGEEGLAVPLNLTGYGHHSFEGYLLLGCQAGSVFFIELSASIHIEGGGGISIFA